MSKLKTSIYVVDSDTAYRRLHDMLLFIYSDHLTGGHPALMTEVGQQTGYSGLMRPASRFVVLSPSVRIPLVGFMIPTGGGGIILYSQLTQDAQ